MVPGTESFTIAITVCVPVLIWSSRGILYVAVWPAATIAISIVIAANLDRRTLLSLVTCKVRMS